MTAKAGESSTQLKLFSPTPPSSPIQQPCGIVDPAGGEKSFRQTATSCSAVVGRGHASVLTNLDTSHSKHAMYIG